MRAREWMGTRSICQREREKKIGTWEYAVIQFPQLQ